MMLIKVLLLIDWMYLVMLYSYTELKVQLFVSFVIFLLHHWFHSSVTDIIPRVIEPSNLGEKVVGWSD